MRLNIHKVNELGYDAFFTIKEFPMPSFDIVAELDQHEVTNAVDQANREVDTRFDFKGPQITLSSQSDFQLKQMLDILEKKLIKRGVNIHHMEVGEPELALNKAVQVITMQNGLKSDQAKDIVKRIKSSKIKVQAAIQGEQVRVTGKKRDDLQETIALLKEAKLNLPLQFVNFRD